MVAMSYVQVRHRQLILAARNRRRSTTKQHWARMHLHLHPKVAVVALTHLSCSFALLSPLQPSVHRTGPPPGSPVLPRDNRQPNARPPIVILGVQPAFGAFRRRGSCLVGASEFLGSKTIQLPSGRLPLMRRTAPL